MSITARATAPTGRAWNLPGRPGLRRIDQFALLNG
jgi:hypothetical protein